MGPDCFPITELPGSTPLLDAYLNDFPRVSSFYAHPPTLQSVKAVAGKLQFSPETRRATAAILREQNASWADDPSVTRNIDALADGAHAVVTGQQVGLLTGPAYSFYKAITAIALAKKLTSQGVRCVPVFWMATEDHDFAEVAQAHWIHTGGLTDFQLPADSALANRRVGQIPLGNSVADIAKSAVAGLSGPDTDEVATMIQECLQPEETFGSSFAKFMARAFRGHGLILLDPNRREFHRMVIPLFQSGIEYCERFTKLLLQRGEQLERQKFHVQVKVTESSKPMFLEMGQERVALRKRGGKFFAGQAAFEMSELLDILKHEPERFSGNALLRPVIQDSLLPTVAYIGGPAEIAYYAQTEVLYREVIGRMPVILPRASFTLLEPHVAQLLKKYGLALRDVMVAPAKLRARLEKLALPAGLASRFAKEEKTLTAAWRGLKAPLAKLDKTLAGATENAERKMLYQFQKLRDKAGRAAAFRSDVVGRHLGILGNSVFPHGAPQERVLSLLPFLAKYGFNLIHKLEEQALDFGQHKTIQFD